MSKAITKLRETIGAIGITGHCPAALPFGVVSLDTKLADRGLRIGALHEAAAAGTAWGDDAPVSLFLAGIAARHPGPVLWLVRRRDLFAPALSQSGLASERLIYAEAHDDAPLLAAMEDALRHRGLAAVIGEAGKASLTATRRLQLAAEGGTTLALLLRRHRRAGEDPLAAPSAAMTRWRIGPAPSLPLSVAGVGRARWQIELVRQRGGDPFKMTVEACDEKGRCALAGELVDRPDRSRRAGPRAAA